MRRFLRSEMLLLFLLMTAIGKVFCDRTYVKIFGGGKTVEGDFTVFNNLDRLKCAAMCSWTSGCLVWAWDSATNECRVFNSLAADMGEPGAPGTFRTYGLLLPGIFFTPEVTSWAEAFQSCQEKGMNLTYLEDYQQRILMHYRAHIDKFMFMGLYQSATNRGTWYNMKDEVVKVTDWQYGEPSGGSSELYIMAEKGLYHDADENIYFEGLGICSF